MEIVNVTGVKISSSWKEENGQVEGNLYLYFSEQEEKEYEAPLRELRSLREENRALQREIDSLREELGREETDEAETGEAENRRSRNRRSRNRRRRNRRN